MQLDSGRFVLFLVLVWAAWRILPKVAATWILLAASVLFYASSNLQHLGLLLLVAAFNYMAVRKLTAWPNGRKRAFLFGLAVVFDAGLLLFYKWGSLYLDLGAAPAALLDLLPATEKRLLAFPLGLSFFIFQLIACVTDVYRRKYQWSSGAGSFFLFAFFFPQISSGPIPRASPLVPQLTGPRRPAPGDIEAGISLFAYGLFQKLVIANRLQHAADQVFSNDYHTSIIPVFLGFVFNGMHLYADFSGYTDMARGAARLFGIDLPLNFDRPFRTESMTDFWRCWHMSFSSWLRDYLFMPLGTRVKKMGKPGFVFAILVTFLVCGLWHRLSWTFAIFGLMHGTALSAEFVTRQQRWSWIEQWPWLGWRWLGRSYVFLFFVLTVIMFRVTSVSQAMELYAEVLIPSHAASLGELLNDGGLLLNFLALVGLWGLIAALRAKWAEPHCARFVLLCAVSILFLGSLAEGGFVYVTF
jgi:D-alanyl-lipoteichoic acid acyltransferase DltB (MBOAT superfamily)